MSWEDDDFEPVLPAKVDTSRWDDEDKVKAEEELKASTKKPEPAAPAKPKDNSAKPKVKAAKQAKEIPKTEEEPLDPIAAKLKQQKIVEETDFQQAQSLFSGIDEQININNPKDEKDFDALAKAIGERLDTSYGKSFHYKVFLKTLFKSCCADLKSDEVKDISAALTALYNDKLKTEKDKHTKKVPAKATAATKKLNMKDDFAAYGNSVDDYEEDDDDDFM